MRNLSRRGFLKFSGFSSLAGAAGAEAASARPKVADKPAYTFFTPAEATFIEAAVARLIPADDLGPGALEADVPAFMDKQLGGAWGAGERLYRAGPWQSGTPSQGYQLPLTPAELFRNAIRAIEADLRQRGQRFEALPPAGQDTYLKSLEQGSKDLGGIPAKVFFESLWEMTLEGYFNDPATSVVNRYLQSWDVPNVFVIGASNFPQNASYNPTDTVGALAFWASDALVNRYLKSPGALA